MDKYKKNLRIENGFVLSYNTIVAKIDGKNLIQLGWWSKTTQKHINYVASNYDLHLIDSCHIQNNYIGRGLFLQNK